MQSVCLSVCMYVLCPFLGAFAKLRKATISYVISVCPSVRMEQLSSYMADVHKL